MDRDPQVDQLEQALVAAETRGDCMSCGRTDWMIFERPVVLLASDGEGEGMQALGMACQYCGFVRLHAAQALDQFMRPG